MSFELVPVGAGAESLKKFVIDPSQTYSVILGRNVETGLDKACDHVQHVSRSHVAIHVRQGRVFMDAIARQDGIVFLNGAPCDRGEREIQENDSISLLGTIQHFNYQLKRAARLNRTTSSGHMTSNKRTLSSVNNAPVIELLDDNNHPSSKRSKGSNRSYEEVVSLMSSSSSGKLTQNSPVKTGNVTADAPTKSIGNSQQTTTTATSSTGLSDIIKGLLRQYECAICFETMAGACNLSPCGDAFCFTCIEDWAQQHHTCPLCSGDFDLKNVVTSKIVDNAVREILKNDKPELDAWEARVAEGNTKRKEYLARSAAPPPALVAVPNRNAAVNRGRATGQPVQRRIDEVVDLTFNDRPSAASSNNPNRNLPPNNRGNQSVSSCSVV